MSFETFTTFINYQRAGLRLMSMQQKCIRFSLRSAELQIMIYGNEFSNHLDTFSFRMPSCSQLLTQLLVLQGVQATNVTVYIFQM